MGVAAGGFGETEATVSAFVDDVGATFPFVMDDGSYDLWQYPDSLSPFPRQVLIGADGVVAYIASEHRQADLEAAVRDALGL